MVKALDKAEYKALLDAFWAKVIPDFASRGLSDKDIESTSLETLIDGAKVKGWKALIELVDGVELVYTQEAHEGAPILCNGQAINTEQEA